MKISLPRIHLKIKKVFYIKKIFQLIFQTLTQVQIILYQKEIIQILTHDKMISKLKKLYEILEDFYEKQVYKN